MCSFDGFNMARKDHKGIWATPHVDILLTWLSIYQNMRDMKHQVLSMRQVLWLLCMCQLMKVSPQRYVKGNFVITILQRRKLRHRKLKELAPNRAVCQCGAELLHSVLNLCHPTHSPSATSLMCHKLAIHAYFEAKNKMIRGCVLSYFKFKQE